MTQEFTYSFEELTIDRSYLSAILGFPDGNLPEPFDEYVAEAIQKAEILCDIQGAFCFTESMEFTSDNSHLVVDGIEFGIGKTVAKELRNSNKAAFFICTAGERMSRYSQKMLKGENPVLGYVLDVLGSMIVEAATDELQKEIKQIAFTQGFSITNRYSPGYCKWSVGDQHKLFSFFPVNCCGIRLTESALMHPIKSVSGIIGIGKEVKFRQYTCDLCNQVDCFHKNHQRMI
ncbi:MAG TPA: hypothetical protein DCL77_08885 [Prolixibacteraceae bacterium]|jgi:hypothetical protein|nr:hypothetical protein [Prolixibacteraceae bacterium]